MHEATQETAESRRPFERIVSGRVGRPAARSIDACRRSRAMARRAQRPAWRGKAGRFDWHEPRATSAGSSAGYQVRYADMNLAACPQLATFPENAVWYRSIQPQ